MIYLERQARLDLLLQNFTNGSVEVAKDLHRQLRVDTMLRDQVIEGIGKRCSDTAAIGCQHVSPYCP
jgi:hypothetical protein